METGAQADFQFRLIEEIVVGPAETPRHADTAHIADDITIGAEMHMALGFARQRQDGVDQAHLLEQAHHFVVEMDGARQGKGAGELFQHQDLVAGLAQEVGDDRADRAATDDDDVVAHDKACFRKASRRGAAKAQWLVGSVISSAENHIWPAPKTGTQATCAPAWRRRCAKASD